MNEIIVIALGRHCAFVVVSILTLLFGIKPVLKTSIDTFPNIKIPVISIDFSSIK